VSREVLGGGGDDADVVRSCRAIRRQARADVASGVVYDIESGRVDVICRPAPLGDGASRPR